MAEPNASGNFERVVAKHSPSTATFGKLPIEIWEQIVCYFDVIDLGKCVLVSKQMNALAKIDAAWEPYLRKLLRKFDGAFHFTHPDDQRRSKMVWTGYEYLPTPLSERPLESTNFRLWFVEWEEVPSLARINGEAGWKKGKYSIVRGCYKKEDGTEIEIRDMASSESDPEESYRWLMEDVPLRTYYEKAAKFACNNFIREQLFHLCTNWIRIEIPDMTWTDPDETYRWLSEIDPLRDPYGYRNACQQDKERWLAHNDTIRRQLQYFERNLARDGIIELDTTILFSFMPNIRLFQGLGGFRYFSDYWQVLSSVSANINSFAFTIFSMRRGLIFTAISHLRNEIHSWRPEEFVSLKDKHRQALEAQFQQLNNLNQQELAARSSSPNAWFDPNMWVCDVCNPRIWYGNDVLTCDYCGTPRPE